MSGDPFAHQIIGRYRVTARIATGGMAEVLLAQHEGPEGFRKTVVLKRLLPHLAKDPQVVAMFLNEARIAGRLDHANVVQVFDLGQDGDQFFLAMELLDGRSLSEVRKSTSRRSYPLPLAFGLKVLADALAGLHYAHEATDDEGTPLGIVHRDFSPDNILVTYDGRVKVVDFGIAKAAAIASHTEPGTLKGKYLYMSPEMVVGEPLDRRADLFAAGVILYDLLTGRCPFISDNPVEVLALIQRCEPAPPSVHNARAPPDLEALTMRCLARQPDDRPATAQEVRAAIEANLSARGTLPTAADLGAYLERVFPAQSDPDRRRLAQLRKQDRGSTTAPTPPKAVPTPTRRRRRAVRIGAGVAVLVALGGGAAIALRAPSAPDNPAELYRQGVKLAARDPAAAVQLLRRAVRAAPGDVRAAMALGGALIATGDADDAQELAADWTRKRPDLSAAHVLLGDAYRAKRQGAKAEAEYALAAQLAPKEPTPLKHLAELRVAMGDLPRAAEAFEKARALAPRDSALVVRLGQVKARLGDWTGAAALLAPAARSMPEDVDVQAELGFALHQTGQHAKAVAELLAATRKDPRHARAHYYLGFAHYASGQTQKAIEAYREAAARDPAFADAHAALGDLYAQQGRGPDAAREYREALRIDPKHDAATAGLRRFP